MSNWIIYAIGFLAQAFFSARILVQWFLSEKTRQSTSPKLYWIFSLCGAAIMLFYGWLRVDFSIILGQLLTYYIYIWNLKEQGVWNPLHRPFIHVLILLLPPLFVGLTLAAGGMGTVVEMFNGSEVSTWLLIYGSIGQVVFTLRFVYQFFYSHQRKASLLPAGFWIISLIGSGLIVSYGLFRSDPVLILGQSVGFIAYTRNLMIIYQKKENA